MNRRPIHATATSYAQAYEVTRPSRVLFVSGQVPVTADGSVPSDFKSQCRLVWKNIETQLKATDMAMSDLTKITVYLSDRRYRHENFDVRCEVLGGSITPAMTVVITGIYEEQWLLEIEAIAVA